MSKILYIGDYFPEHSSSIYLTDYIARKLKQQGHDVVLLSKSWCTATKDTFVHDVDLLTKADSFSKKYYVDPIQLKLSNIGLFAAMLGLGEKIIKYEGIDYILYADNAEYVPLVELFRSHFSLRCDLLLYRQEQMAAFLDNYIYPFVRKCLGSFDNIYTFPEYEQFEHYIFDEKVDSFKASEPFCNGKFSTENTQSNSKAPIYIICTNYSQDRVESLLRTAQNTLLGSFSDIILAFPVDPNQFALHELNVAHLHATTVNAIPTSSYVIWDKELLSNQVDLLSIMLSLNMHWLPLVSSRAKDTLEEGRFFVKQIGQDFFAVLSCQTNYPTVANIIISDLVNTRD